ncbi:uncharacterized protein RHO25_010042 [Cercospora beticola]|uniref:Uncharacterized protein n=1 Tax=Cercospora beticola TaxID=122368 RepID=A0ABZ0P0S8_CERBT|nr:hypothetical protein RHO25_010042 [Cercospora beticola]
MWSAERRREGIVGEESFGDRTGISALSSNSFFSLLWGSKAADSYVLFTKGFCCEVSLSILRDRKEVMGSFVEYSVR